jgi:HK97 family phage major capsid protein
MSDKTELQKRAATDPILTGGPIPASGLIPVKPYLDIIGNFRQSSITALFNIIPVGTEEWPVIYTEQATEGTATNVDEGDAKPQLSFPVFNAVRTNYLKAAAIMKVSNELLDDAPQYEALVKSRLMYEVIQDFNHVLLSGGGAFPGILNTTGVNVGTEATVSEAIVYGQQQVMINSGRPANGLIISPTTFAQLMNEAGAMGMLFMNQPETVYDDSFGEGFIYRFYGLHTIITTDCPDGEVIVGDFRKGAYLGIREVAVRQSNSDVDNFQKNLVTVVGEIRSYLGIINPEGFSKITISVT